MITVKKYHVRKREDGTEFISLELAGDVCFVQSQNTGRFYAATKRCFMFAAFDEETAKELIGSKMPGSIERVSCDPYQFTIPQTGEVVTLAYSYHYKPEGVESAEAPIPQKAFA